ncbi:MAG: helix-turn-helix domain-containing protein [Nitrospirota bacterium]|nr:helix-turn-helix domain-containing protein [Nitrospirota bacterium]
MVLLNVKEVSQWLQVKPSTVYLWAAEGKIPALKIQGVIRFQREKIDAWLAGCQLETPDPSRPANQRPRSSEIDGIIATAKAEVYTSSHGKPDQDRATRKGDSHGSV